MSYQQPTGMTVLTDFAVVIRTMGIKQDFISVRAHCCLEEE
ncbi:hypothetical protein [Anaplasma phagocytophilum]|uniref:Uncharacterized protein n=1 Tax=Anaplasma phagocytophilum (strain HZ) TaxID=212042 RepID=Q2GKL3_ANAPZ|nr:hypothetical protein [Anaplasma phagocytophilum]ABD43920.1 hypothetical protein APH_0489 [Anaplasma phagocytophilum str. HZ]KKA00882.1 hypothetical protein APHCR_1501 [Anaplasma phagocytophilum str. CR1007]